MIPALVGTRFAQLAKRKEYPKYGAGVTIDGKYYPSVIMPDRSEWLAYNLDYGSSGRYYNYDESTYGWNGLKYGKLYTWVEAVAAASTISRWHLGWHLPSADEWDALATAVGGVEVAGAKLKSSTNWTSGRNGTNDYGFSAFPAGFWNSLSDTFYDLGPNAYFWTATTYASYDAYYRYFGNGALMYSNHIDKANFAFSVRLVKD